MTAPSYVDATFTTVTSGTTTVAAVVPGGSGKLYALCEANASSVTWACSHTGVITPTVMDGNSPIDDTVRGMRIFEHPGDGTEGSPGSTITFTRSGTTTGIGGVFLVRVANAGSLQSVRLASQNASTITLTGRTATGADTLVLQAPAMTNVSATTWIEPGGTTEHFDAASPGGVHGAVGSDVIGAGASGDRIWTRSASSGTNRGFLLLINPAITIEPDDAAHAHAATSPTLTQHQILTTGNAAHAHSATVPTLVQHQALAVDPASHAHAATSPTLTQHQVLTVADATHAHDATSPTLTPAGSTSVEPDDANHTHTATSPALTQHHALSTDGALHTHSATSPALTQHHALSVNGATHAHAATSPSLSAGSVPIEPDDTSHAHAATSPTLTQRHILAVDAALHTHAATSPTVHIHAEAPDERRSTTPVGSRTSTTAVTSRNNATPVASSRASDTPVAPRTSP